MDVLKSGGKKCKRRDGLDRHRSYPQALPSEKQAKEAALEPEQIRQLRRERSKPIMEKIKNLLLERGKTTPPKSLLGKAITYALGQWSRMEVYLADGRLSPDNNPAENAIRPFAVARKTGFSPAPRPAPLCIRLSRPPKPSD